MNMARSSQFTSGVSRSGRWIGRITAALLCGAATTARISAAPQQISSELRVVGTDTMKELMNRWITAFVVAHPGIHVEAAASGALTAAPALTNGSADLVPLGRELTPPELNLFRKVHGYDPVGVRVALGSYDRSGRTVALAFFVHQSNPVTQLSFQQLQRIYCLHSGSDEPERPVTWGELGMTGKFAAMEVRPIGVNFPDGISNFIRLRLCPDRELRSNIRTEHTGGAVNVLQRIVSDVGSDPAAIGYAGFSNQQPGTRIVPISADGRQYLSGTREEVARAEYPLTRFIYVYVDRKPGDPVPPLQLAFLRFVLSQAGQALVAADGMYMPLPTAIAEHELEGLEDASIVVKEAH